MVKFATVLLRGVIATFTGLLVAGGTLTLAADRATGQRPTLVPAAPSEPATLTVPDVSGQAYVFAKGVLQDQGFAWHVSGPVQGYAANTVVAQRPTAGTVVLDTGAPLLTLTLVTNPSYVERGTPENDAPYDGTAIKLPAHVAQRPQTSAAPRLEPVPAPVTPAPKATLTPAPTPTTATPTPAALTPTAAAPVTPSAPAAKTPVAKTPAAPTPAKATAGTRTPDFAVAGAPKEPARSKSLSDRVAALAAWLERHRDPTAANLNHWLYEHAYVVAGARFGWWHGVEALQALIQVDKRAESLWGVGSQSRTAAEKALAEVRSRSS